MSAGHSFSKFQMEGVDKVQKISKSMNSCLLDFYSTSHRHSLEPLEATYVLLENDKSLPEVLLLMFSKLQMKWEIKRCYISFSLYYTQKVRNYYRKDENAVLRERNG